MASLHSLWFLLSLSCTSLWGVSHTRHEILGLGSAFIDYILKVSEEDLSSLRYAKGSSEPIDYTHLQSLLNKHPKEIKSSSGGSCANVIKGLAKLGQRCAVLGNIGSDAHGLFYLKSLKDLDIVPFVQEGILPTGQALCLITPDGEMTSRSYLGASKEDFPINGKIFHKIKLFHVEAYQLRNCAFLKEALDLAQKQEAKISLDLSNVDIVKIYKDDLLNIIPRYIDILFANESEAFELTHLPPQEACDFLGTFCEVVAITMGDKGCWVKSGKIKFYTPALNVVSVDPTGAGDLFASGFLHGYLNNKSLQACAWLGS
ncbi:MAG: adenosine kinase, partial [Chlamydiae bacterium]|nr:adenosine kinase [Chlamydiota bacterium]